jgi:hypothetical protein
MTAAGDKTKAESAKNSLTYAIIALALLLTAGLILRVLIPGLFLGTERNIFILDRTSVN